MFLSHTCIHRFENKYGILVELAIVKINLFASKTLNLRPKIIYNRRL